MSKVYLMTEEQMIGMLSRICDLSRHTNHQPTRDTLSKILYVLRDLPSVSNTDRIDECIDLLNKLLK